MSTTTLRAHCGACAGLMILEHPPGCWRYRCQSCGLLTEPRATPAEAAEGAVWVPASEPLRSKLP